MKQFGGTWLSDYVENSWAVLQRGSRQHQTVRSLVKMEIFFNLMGNRIPNSEREWNVMTGGKNAAENHRRRMSQL